jgi:cytochrome oxidase assembly protein ShyY1
MWDGSFYGFRLLVLLGAAAVYVIFFIAFWKLMRAHEKLAGTLKEIADNLKTKPNEP